MSTENVHYRSQLLLFTDWPGRGSNEENSEGEKAQTVLEVGVLSSGVAQEDNGEARTHTQKHTHTVRGQHPVFCLPGDGPCIHHVKHLENHSTACH